MVASVFWKSASGARHMVRYVPRKSSRAGRRNSALETEGGHRLNDRDGCNLKAARAAPDRGELNMGPVSIDLDMVEVVADFGCEYPSAMGLPPCPDGRAPALLRAPSRQCAARCRSGGSLRNGRRHGSVGCRAYAFGKQRLKRVAEFGTHSWLRVMDDSHHFVFLIDQVPVRFYRGMADDPTARTLRRQEAEAQQLGLALGDEMAEGLIFRLALEADAKGGVDRVVFLALRGEEGHAECAWSVLSGSSRGARPWEHAAAADRR